QFHRPVRFEAVIKPLLPPEKPLTVNLVLQPPHMQARVYRMHAEGQTYHRTAIPVPPSPGPLKLAVSVAFPDGSLRGLTTDRAFQVGERTVRLSEVRGVRWRAGSRVVGYDGKRLSGAIRGLAQIPIELGRQTLSVDLHTAVKMELEPVADAGSVACALVVTSGDRELFQQHYTMMHEGLIKNPGFEAGVKGWVISTWSGSPAQFAADAEIAHEGWQSMRVTAAKASDTGCTQEIVQNPGHWYRFSGWVRTRGLQTASAELFGAFLIRTHSGLVAQSANHGGDTDWTEVQLTFQAPPGDGWARIDCHLAGGGQATGTVWFDDLNLVEVAPPFNASPDTSADKAKNLLVNGSFEEGPQIPKGRDAFITLEKGSTALTGWVVSQGNINVVERSFWEAANGKRSLDLNGSMRGGVSQTFKTKKGQRYRLTFVLAGSNPGAAPQEKRLQISVGGKATEFTFDTTGKTTSDMGWVRKVWEFKAEADTTTLDFLSLTEGADGPALDDVAVVAIRE
ncbi:MAG TPA: choice-of-anchor C family protein, partial [Gemmataceae bacterium]|nr:choice-of-anchor C family protein [Gemmataceae bacterium]